MVTAQVGISVEPLAELAGQTSAIENTSSSAAGCAREVPGTSEAYVPISAVKRWFDAIQRKLSLDPNFWKK
ncbi:hypothetical protein TcWFU_007349 [Taenia crassiceps]|uniref:Hikeshi-like C-terminal domain-containing protein n=1 Tax=Taenia crassiceps TaxID=6207 RepID=A0ABR4QS31_9CEST